MGHSIVTGLIKWFSGLTMVLIVCVFWSELINVKKSSLELATIAYEAMQESCEYFSQETYLGSDGSNSRGLAFNIRADDNTTVISGDFYKAALGGATTEKEVYNSLFDNSERPYDHLDYILDELKDKCRVDVQNFISIETLEEIIDGKYRNSLVRPTPTNLGYTYLNSRVLRQIFTWNLANKLSASSIYKDNYRRRKNILQDMDKTDGDDLLGEYYVKWNGFRIYLTGEGKPQVSINERDIKVVSIYDTDKVGEGPYENTFEELTGVKVGPWGDSTNYGYGYFSNKGTIEPKFARKDAREFKVIYKPKWRLRIAYEGILPLYFVKKLIHSKTGHSFELLRDSSIIGATGDSVLPNIYEGNPENAQSVIAGDKSNEVVSEAIWTINDETWTNGGKVDSLSSEEIDEGNIAEGFASGKNLGVGQSLYYCVVH